MSNFKFKAANGEIITIGEITHSDNAVIGNGYMKSDYTGFFSDITDNLCFYSDGTSGQAGITTCNNSYNILDKDMLNDAFVYMGGGMDGKGALGKYVFYKETSNNNAIPSWCNYIRVLLIGGGGGGSNAYGGGAGEFVLQDISATQNAWGSYNITIGSGGSTGTNSGENGGDTTFSWSSGSLVQTTAEGGKGVVSGQQNTPGGGQSVIITSYPATIRGQGGWGNGPHCGYGAGANDYGPPWYGNAYDTHFGFYVGRTDKLVALIREMRGGEHNIEAYGKGGNSGEGGIKGCACVFFFPYQPPALIPPGAVPPHPPTPPPSPLMTFEPSVVVGEGAGGGDVWYNPTITSDINGHLHAVYLQNGSVQYRVSTDLNQTPWTDGDGGGTYDTGIGSGPGGWAGHYSIKTGAGGNIYVAYGGGEFVGNIEPIGHPGLWFKRKVGGTWSPPNINCGTNQCSRQLVTPMTPPPPVSPTPLLGPSVRYVSMAVATDLSGDDHVYISYQNYYYKQLEFLTLKPNIDLGFVNPTRIDFYVGGQIGEANASSICVSPTWPQTGKPHVFIAWLEAVAETYSVKFRKSTDGGDTWDPSLNSPAMVIDNGGAATGTGVTINLCYTENNILYLSYINTSQQLVLRKSTDGGDTWSPAAAIPGTYSVFYAHDMYVEPAAGDDIWISYYVGVQSQLLLCCIYSSNGGQTWLLGSSINSNNDPRMNAITVVGDKAYIIGPATNFNSGTGEASIKCVTVEIS